MFYLDFKESLAVAIGTAGGIVGCITTGNATIIGRRLLLIIVGIVFIIGVGLSLIGNYVFFVIGRLIKGVCMGYYSSLTPLYSTISL